MFGQLGRRLALVPTAFLHVLGRRGPQPRALSSAASPPLPWLAVSRRGPQSPPDPGSVSQGWVGPPRFAPRLPNAWWGGRDLSVKAGLAPGEVLGPRLRGLRGPLVTLSGSRPQVMRRWSGGLTGRPSPWDRWSSRAGIGSARPPHSVLCHRHL